MASAKLSPMVLPEAVKNLLAGSCAGVGSTLICHPLDTVRTRLQTNTQFRGAFHCMQETVAKEGISAFYKGLSFPLAAQGVYKANMFFSYGMAQRMVRQMTGKKSGPLTPAQLAISGGVTGGWNSFLVTPIELVRNRLQVQYGTGTLKYKGPVDAVLQVVREHGITGMWKGQKATLCRDIPGVGAWYFTYEVSRTALTDKNGQIGTVGVLTAGGLAGLGFWAVALPVDTVKSLIQTDLTGKYSGLVDCVKTVMREEGVGRFWRGWTMAFTRGVPGAAATFYIFSSVSDVLKKY